MFSSDKEFIAQKVIVEFTLPKLHKGKSWYVDFWAYDPVRGKSRRKKFMLNRYKTKKEKERIAAILMHNLFEKLKCGWNPFVNAERTRQYTKFNLVIQRYQDYITMAERKGVMKTKTAIDYRSRLNQLMMYIEETEVSIMYVYQFDKNFIIDFLDYLLLDKDNSPTTRNNYRTWLSTFGTWLVDRQYLDNNPVETIHMMREGEKYRDPLTAEDLARVREYTKRYNPSFYLACLMEYYTFIRPDELRHLKVGDISIEEQSVYVSGEVSKNRKGQAVALNDTILKQMIEQGVFSHPSHEYLFSENLIPGEKPMYANKLRFEWLKVRRALNFPDSYQFYSLKDSGIRDLANAEGIVVARDQARHSDITVTNRYLKNRRVANEITKHYKGEL